LIRGLRLVNVCNYQLLQLDEKNKSKKSEKIPLGFAVSSFKKGEQDVVKEKVQLFDFSAETWESIKKNTPLLAHVAKERIKEELCKPFIK